MIFIAVCQIGGGNIFKSRNNISVFARSVSIIDVRIRILAFRYKNLYGSYYTLDYSTYS